ncbi:MAG TPA: phytanoyl-CoA dioxygenase family protein [Acidimicrobiia bacterium]|nr:phytanoyl-CoA dioxygenase family protein [Acidimicrobiia bacterium]
MSGPVQAATGHSAQWPDHVLTPSERERFEREGFLLVERALPHAVVDRFGTLAQRYFAELRASPESNAHTILNLHDLVGRDDAFLELVDWPMTFPKVFGVLGWHIQLFHTQLIVTPPTHPQAPAGAYAWHQDNNRMNRDFEPDVVQPRVSVKVGYFLTDVDRTGMGNLCVVPGSHRVTRQAFAEFGDDPPGAIELCARAGDAVVFDRRLWHAASTNHSTSTRVFLTYGYSHRWLRPKSAMRLDEVLGGVDPIRRQLLGATTSANAWFDPTPDDVPLREWIAEHLGSEAVAP